MRLRLTFSNVSTTSRIALLIGAVSLVACHGQPSTASLEGAEDSSKFTDALARAESVASTDEIASIVTIDKAVRLTGQGKEHVSRFLRLPDKFIISNLLSGRVEAYGTDGSWLYHVGRRGTAPGAYMMPTGLAAVSDAEFAVLDFRPSRISVFGSSGEFLKSVVYTRHRFAGVQLARLADQHDYYVFGWRAGSRESRAPATLMHRLSDTGTLISSAVPAPDERTAPWAAHNYDPVVAATHDQVFAAFPFSNEIYRMDQGGNLSVALHAYPENFRAPRRVLRTNKDSPNEPAEDHYRQFQAWRTESTPIDGIAVVGDTLLVALQTFSPLRYTIESWSLSRQQRVAVAHTNHLLLGADANGTVYFWQSADLNKEPNDAILMATLRR